MDTEKWIQCFKCKKWRVITDTLQVGPSWECKYNLFDTKHNTCKAPQEKMPHYEEEEEEEEEEEMDLDDICQEEMFTPSTCTCKVCSEINAAVTKWKDIPTHSIPLVNCIIKSISATEQMAHQAEDEKQFMKGVHIDLHNPLNCSKT